VRLAAAQLLVTRLAAPSEADKRNAAGGEGAPKAPEPDERASADERALSSRALWRCAVEDRHATVAEQCAAPPRQVKGTDDVLIYVVPDGRAEPVARAPFALVLADGAMRLGVADRRGVVFEAAAPEGALELAVPAALAP
jgi:hypothetical protein